MKPIRHKFGAKATERNGIRYDSKLEARYADWLKEKELGGELLFVLRQVPIRLPGNVIYRVDFQEFWANGIVRFTDVKGMETPVFVMKKKQVEEIYPIELYIVKRVGDAKIPEE